MTRSRRRHPWIAVRTTSCRTTRPQRAVLACVGELPEVYESALRLHYWLGASMSEIAEMLDAPENTVKSYLHRARQLLHANADRARFRCAMTN